MNILFKTAWLAVAMVAATQVGAQVTLPLPAQLTLFEHEGFGGRASSTDQEVSSFERSGFNRASSVVVVGAPWEVCENRRFAGQCVVLLPGRYESPRAMGLNSPVSSVRHIHVNTRVDDRR
jgi:hypothetical protein